MAESSRSVVPNKEEIERLRKLKGWTVEDLAEETGLSLRTVQNALRGSAVDLRTLRIIAEKLGVEYQKLVVDEPQPIVAADDAQTSHASDQMITISFSVAVSKELLERSENAKNFIENLRQFIGAVQKMGITGIEDGSAIITVTMTPGDAEKLVEHFLAGHLDQFLITEVRVPDDENYAGPERGKTLQRTIDHSKRVLGLRGRHLDRAPFSPPPSTDATDEPK